MQYSPVNYFLQCASRFSSVRQYEVRKYNYWFDKLHSSTSTLNKTFSSKYYFFFEGKERDKMSNSIKKRYRGFYGYCKQNQLWVIWNSYFRLSWEIKFASIARCNCIACRPVPLRNTDLFCESRGTVCLYSNGGKLASHAEPIKFWTLWYKKVYKLKLNPPKQKLTEDCLRGYAKKG